MRQKNHTPSDQMERGKHRNKQIQQGDFALSDGRIVEYEVIKSARRTMAVQVTRKGQVLVRIPNRVPFEEAHFFAEKHKEWILEHQDLICGALKKKEEEYWGDGTQVLLHGNMRPLHLEQDFEAARFRVCDTGSRILISGPFTEDDGLPGCTEAQDHTVKEALFAWYRKQAKAYLSDKTAQWARRMNVTYYRISIRDQATRWGSCSQKGNINYNWKLVLVPEELTDYVVVHELAHRLHMDHSSAFWGEVEQELPDYRQRRRKLQDYETIINQKY